MNEVDSDMRSIPKIVASVLLMFAAFIIPPVFKAFDTYCWRTMDNPKMLPWLWIICGPLVGTCFVFSFLIWKDSYKK